MGALCTTNQPTKLKPKGDLMKIFSNAFWLAIVLLVITIFAAPQFLGFAVMSMTKIGVVLLLLFSLAFCVAAFSAKQEKPHNTDETVLFEVKPPSKKKSWVDLLKVFTISYVFGVIVMTFLNATFAFGMVAIPLKFLVNGLGNFVTLAIIAGIGYGLYKLAKREPSENSEGFLSKRFKRKSKPV